MMDFDEILVGIILIIALVLGIIFCCFFSFDFASGATVGKITSVDDTIFGYTKLYIKTTEQKEEEYCIENQTVKEIAQENVGKEVKISYGKRVGFRFINQCSDSPVEKIERVEE